MENKTPKYHPKAAFALFLNQAEHNLVKAVGEISGNNKLQERSSSDKTINAICELPTEQFRKLEYKYLKFLKGDKQEMKQHFLILIVEHLYSLRNYYSHNYHLEDPLFLNKENSESKQIVEYLENKYEQIVDELKGNFELSDLEHLNYKNAKIELAKHFKINIDTNFDDKVANKYKNNIQIQECKNKDNIVKITNETLHEKAGAYIHYRLFKEDEDKYKFEKKAVTLLTSFFLDKRQANLFVSKISGFKKTHNKKDENNKNLTAKATRSCYTHYHMHDPKSNFVSQNANVAFYLDVISYLSKTPKIVLENTKNQTYEFTRGSYSTITDMIYNQYPKKRAEIRQAKGILEEIKNLENLENEKITGVSKFTERVIKEIGKNTFEKYKEIIINHSLRGDKLRTTKNRFTNFALQYIDDFDLLPNIKFKVYTGEYEIEKEIKTYHGTTFPEKEIIKRKTEYGAIKTYPFSQRQKVGQHYYKNWDDYVNDFLKNKEKLGKDKKVRKIFKQVIKYNPANYDYYIKNNNVFFKAQKSENCTYYGSISTNELRNIVFALIDKGSDAVENEIFNILAKNNHLYEMIINKQEKAGIIKFIEDNFPNKKIPQYILKWLNEKQYSDSDFKNDILNKLNYIETENNRLKEKIKKLRKYEKIREIVKFVNRFNSERRGKDQRRGYLDIEQHEDIEILLGNFPKSEKELIFFLKENDIKTEPTNFKDIVQNKASLDSLLYKIIGASSKWCTKRKKEVNKTTELKILENIAKFINVTRKEYTNKRITENINKFLKNNIVIPRKFVIDAFYKNENITSIITEKAKDIKLASFYDNVINYKNNFDNYKKFGIKINQQKTKDQVLLLMAKKYLDQLTKGTAKDLVIDTDIRNVLQKQEIIIEKEINTYKLTKEHIADLNLGNQITANLNKIENIVYLSEDLFKQGVGKKIFNKNKSALLEKAKIEETKKLIFNIKDYDKILPTLEDKRINKILQHYFRNKTEVLFQYRQFEEDKQQEKREELTQEQRFECKLNAIYLQDALKKIDCEQIRIVDLVLKLEKEILFVLIKDENHNIPTGLIKWYFNNNYKLCLTEKQEESKDKNHDQIHKVVSELLKLKTKEDKSEKYTNRIEPEKLLKTKFTANDVNKVKLYRNAAFHNLIPDNGMLEDGIKIIVKMRDEIFKEREVHARKGRKK